VGERVLKNRNILLAGFMATGKTSVGEALSRLTGFEFIDADRILEERFGLSITEVFETHGEGRFRQEERKLALELSQRMNCVIATGGGMITDDGSRAALMESGDMFCLNAKVETILERAGDLTTRPLIAGADPEERIREIFASRKHVYGSISHQIDTDDLSPVSVAVLILGKLSPCMRRVEIPTPAGDSYPILFGRKVIEELPNVLEDCGPGREVFVVSDSNVFSLHSNRLSSLLENSGFTARLFVFPAGETSKTADTVTRTHSFLAGMSAQRDSTVIAFGGGVVGDVTGFAASTYMRGIRLIHVPTTLMAQCDSSIGGKNGVNTPSAKNLVGTFYHPYAVLTDPDFLLTLPDREFRSGFSEVVKTAIIEGEDAFGTLELLFDHISNREIPFLEPVMFRAIRQKAGIVGRDPLEKGERRVLNLGHTFGHAIEQARGYEGISHGEAVAAGMRTATLISRNLGKLPARDAARIIGLLERSQLLVDTLESNRGRVTSMLLDKKARKGKLTIVVPAGMGEIEIMEDLEPDTLTAFLEEIHEEDPGDPRPEPEEAREERT
jgi:shikimate kinase/3-dehydroquinate synthase